MSYSPAITWAFSEGRRLNLPPHARMVLLAFVEAMEEGTLGRHGLNDWAWDTGLDPLSIQRMITLLKKHGLVDRRFVNGVLRYFVLSPAESHELEARS